MPIKTERITKGIYLHSWQGHVTADEAVKASKLEEKLGYEDNCDKYIIILDGSNVRTIPFNLLKLAGSFSGNELSTLIYKAPAMGQKLGEIVGAMVHMPVEFFDDWDITLARAYQLLEENKSTVFRSESA